MRGRFGEFPLRAEWRVTPYCPVFKGRRGLQVFQGGEDGSEYWTRETSHGKMEISSPPKYGKCENIWEECEVGNPLEENEGFFGLGGDALRKDEFYNHREYDLCMRAT